MERIGAYRILSDSTLKSFSKDSLIDIIRLLEHNWRATEIRCENQMVFLERLVNSLEKKKQERTTPASSEN